MLTFFAMFVDHFGLVDGSGWLMSGCRCVNGKPRGSIF